MKQKIFIRIALVVVGLIVAGLLFSLWALLQGHSDPNGLWGGMAGVALVIEAELTDAPDGEPPFGTSGLQGVTNVTVLWEGDPTFLRSESIDENDFVYRTQPPWKVRRGQTYTMFLTHGPWWQIMAAFKDGEPVAFSDRELEILNATMQAVGTDSGIEALKAYTEEVQTRLLRSWELGVPRSDIRPGPIVQAVFPGSIYGPRGDSLNAYWKNTDPRERSLEDAPRDVLGDLHEFRVPVQIPLEWVEFDDISLCAFTFDWGHNACVPLASGPTLEMITFVPFAARLEFYLQDTASGEELVNVGVVPVTKRLTQLTVSSETPVTDTAQFQAKGVTISQPEPPAAVEPLSICSAYPSGFGVQFDVTELNTYGEARPETWGGWWVANGGEGPVIIWVTDDAANHNEVLNIVGDSPPVEFRTADHTVVELEAAANQVDTLGVPDLIGVNANTMLNQVTIQVLADTEAVQEALKDADRNIYCLVPHTGPFTPWGTQAQSGEHWRLLGETLQASPYAVAISSTPEGLASMWKAHFTGPQPQVDFDTEVVLYFGGVVSSSCPQILLSHISISHNNGLVYSIFSRPGVSACTLDARPHGYAVAVERSSLPNQFTLQMRGDLPPGVAEEFINVDLTGTPQDEDGWTYP